MTALVVETPATVTPWSVAHALSIQHAVLIRSLSPADEHVRQAQAAEARTIKIREPT